MLLVCSSHAAPSVRLILLDIYWWDLLVMVANLWRALGVWRSREDARAGGTGPWHAQARGAAKTMYERIEFMTLELVVGEKAGDWEFKDWKD